MLLRLRLLLLLNGSERQHRRLGKGEGAGGARPALLFVFCLFFILHVVDHDDPCEM